MNQRGLTLLEVFILVIVIGILAALFIPPTCGDGLRTNCSANLGQLYKVGTIYASMHKGEWPGIAGDELWLSFTRTTPPLIEEEHRAILACRVQGEECAPGETHYRGPRVPWKQLRPGEPLAADKPGNHGDDYGGNVLFKDGSVHEAALRDPLWQQCAEKLRP